MEIFIKETAENTVYGYRTKENCESEVIYSSASDLVAGQAAKLALQIYRAMNCRDVGRIDLKADINGSPQFIEINPIPGLHPAHSDLPMIAERCGISYRELISEIIISAQKRYSLEQK